MTQDFLDDFIQACEREGVSYFVVYSTDQCKNMRYAHNLNKLPPLVDYPDGCRRTRTEDMMDLVASISFTND